jgi:hypothetical protein
MIKVNKKINLAQLDQELNGLGLIASLDENREVTEVGLADNNTASETELSDAIKKHKAIDPNLAKQAILDRLGLTVDELKLLLG